MRSDARSQRAGTRSSSSTRCTASTRRSRMRSCRYVEQGLITFIGATTENPSFEVNSALLSRAAVYVLEPLSPDDLAALLDARCGATLPGVAVEPGARRADRLCRRRRAAPPEPARAARHRGGAARAWPASTSPSSTRRSRAACAASTRAATSSTTRSRRCTSRCAARDPDAALYWLARMLDGGADPLYLGAAHDPHGERGHRPRRSARAAARARCGRDLRAAGHARRRARAGRGGDLSRVRAEVATRSTLRTMQARAFIAEDGSRAVPLHLRNAPTRLMKQLGYGKEYRYAHDEEGAYAAGERYFPTACPTWNGTVRPTAASKRRSAEKLALLRGRDAKTSPKGEVSRNGQTRAETKK